MSICGAAGLTLTGCSGSGPATTFQVSGTVKFPDGQPLTAGRILFRPDKDAKYSARGGILEDGTFELSTFNEGDGAIAGVHKVMITPEVDRAALDEPAATRKRAMPVIDIQYQSLRDTPLEVTVTADGSSENHFDLVVEPPKIRGKKRRSR
jgi:hypothetical protein